MACSLSSSRWSSAAIRPWRMTSTRSARRMISGSSDETTITDLPSAARRLDQSVDLGLGADVDAARRLVEQQDLAFGRDPAGDDGLLLVAAAEQPDRPVDLERPQVDAGAGCRSPSLRSARRRMKPRGAKRFIEGSAMLLTTERCGTMPSRLRSSGTRPMPAAMAARGLRVLMRPAVERRWTRRSAGRRRRSAAAVRCGRRRSGRRCRALRRAGGRSWHRRPRVPEVRLRTASTVSPVAEER